MHSTTAGNENGSVESSRRQRTRARLIDAAYEVFSEQGVHAAAIETIVERAGFTRGAFYSNFETKEELFFALAERETTEQIGLLERVIADLQSGEHAPELDEDGIAQLIEGFLATQEEDPRWFLVQGEFKLLAMRNPEVAARYVRYQRHFEQQLARVLETAAAAVDLRFILDAVEIARLCVSVFQSAMEDAILTATTNENRAAHARAMRVLPPLIHALTRPA